MTTAPGLVDTLICNAYVLTMDAARKLKSEL